MKKFAKRLSAALVLAVVGYGVFAWAAPDADPWASVWHQYIYRKPVRFDVEVGSNFIDAGTITVNTGLVVGAGKAAVSRIVTCPRIDWDFASVIPRPGFIQETDKATCTGISIGDPCFVGVTNATPQDGGSAWEDNVHFDCIARGVNQMQVRMTTASGDGGVTNPPDAGYQCMCIK